MSTFESVLCAVDASPLAPRVLRHAVGIAGALGARLSVLMVVTDDRHHAEQKIAALLKEALPPGAGYLGQPKAMAVQLVMGTVADVVLTVAGEGVDLIVTGTQSKSGLSRWFLGSTSVALLEQAPCPILLVPPGETDIVAVDAQSARLRPGAVLAAVDLAEVNARQLRVAGEFATLAGTPLTLMTVTGDDGATADATAAQALTALAERVHADVQVRTLVRHGSVAAEIDHAAVDEHAGLVVMGLRSVDRGTPGEIATAVLKQKDAIVLAVPA